MGHAYVTQRDKWNVPGIKGATRCARSSCIYEHDSESWASMGKKTRRATTRERKKLGSKCQAIAWKQTLSRLLYRGRPPRTTRSIPGKRVCGLHTTDGTKRREKRPATNFLGFYCANRVSTWVGGNFFRRVHWELREVDYSPPRDQREQSSVEARCVSLVFFLSVLGCISNFPRDCSRLNYGRSSGSFYWKIVTYSLGSKSN